MTHKEAKVPEHAVQYVKDHFPAEIDMNKEDFKEFVDDAIDGKHQKGSAALAQKKGKEGPPKPEEIIKECDSDADKKLSKNEALTCMKEHGLPEHISSIVEKMWPAGANLDAEGMGDLMKEIKEIIEEHHEQSGDESDDENEKKQKRRGGRGNKKEKKL